MLGIALWHETYRIFSPQRSQRAQRFFSSNAKLPNLQNSTLSCLGIRAIASNYFTTKTQRLSLKWLFTFSKGKKLVFSLSLNLVLE